MSWRMWWEEHVARMGEMRNFGRDAWREGDCSDHAGVDGRIILEWILLKYRWKV